MRKNEQILIKHLDNYGLDIFSLSQLSEANILGKQQLKRTIANLIRNRYIDVIERGKYCRHNFKDHFVIGSFVTENGVISYWNAMNYHGLTEQIPNVIYVKTNTDKRAKTYFGIRYFFSRKPIERINGFIVEGYGNHKFRISNIERTIVDAFDKPDFSGGYAEIIKAFYKANLEENRLIQYCKSENNASLTKRIAFLTELFDKPKMNNFLKYAQKLVKDKYTLFEINGEQKGKTNSRWKIILNIPQNEILEIAKS